MIIPEPVEVAVKYDYDGLQGPGWYVWEVDAEDEGYVFFSKDRPTNEVLKEICPQYVIQDI